jgi:hypothetical protein
MKKPKIPLAEADHEVVREMARSLDAVADFDFRKLAGITQITEASWRRQGTGPSYVLIGTRYYYPRAAVAEFMAAKIRARGPVSGLSS